MFLTRLQKKKTQWLTSKHKLTYERFLELLNQTDFDLLHSVYLAVDNGSREINLGDTYDKAYKNPLESLLKHETTQNL